MDHDFHTDGVPQIRNFPALMFSVRAVADRYNVQFDIFRIHGFYMTPDGEIPFFRKINSNDEFDSIDKSSPFISGYVKWDGCSNWMFNDCYENCMIHACDKEGLEHIGIILATCWDWAHELRPDFE